MDHCWMMALFGADIHSGIGTVSARTRLIRLWPMIAWVSTQIPNGGVARKAVCRRGEAWRGVARHANGLAIAGRQQLTATSKQSYGVKVTDLCKAMFVMAWCC